MWDPPVFNGQPRVQLLPYFISTDFNDFSKRTISRHSLQLQLKPPVPRQKRLQTTPLPQLSKWHHKLKEILLQLKPTDLQFIPSSHNRCALKYVLLKISLETANLKPSWGWESSKKGTVYRENSTAMLHGLNSSLWHSVNYVKQLENEVTCSTTHSNTLSLPLGFPSGLRLAAQPITCSK